MRRAGFTLLEMLVAMALMSVLAASLYASLHTAFQAQRATEHALEPVARAAAAMRLLRADLESAVLPTGLLAAEFVGEDEMGDGGEDADALLFHALARDQWAAEPPSPIVRVQVGLALDEETDEVVLARYTTTNLLAPEQEDPPAEVLCRRVRSFDLAFYDGSGWTDSWDSVAMGDTLPPAVEVALVLDVQGQEEGYALTRVFALPCGAPEAEGAPASAGGGMPSGAGLGGGR